ncbi:kinase-like protein [Plakobranchus ocellatus]|uniref:Kinase-like protein n=1 Tax=Plakobranchus ocellatus TaxID=259542 RepID=A0AAV3Z680_9GAST|nr:kinase-like protein [Plakobranchus ocellatus]
MKVIPPNRQMNARAELHALVECGDSPFILQIIDAFTYELTDQRCLYAVCTGNRPEVSFHPSTQVRNQRCLYAVCTANRPEVSFHPSTQVTNQGCLRAVCTANKPEVSLRRLHRQQTRGVFSPFYTGKKPEVSCHPPTQVTDQRYLFTLLHSYKLEVSFHPSTQLQTRGVFSPFYTGNKPEVSSYKLEVSFHPSTQVTNQRCLYAVCTAYRPEVFFTLLHRDIKPENVFLLISGHIKLGDFSSSIFLNPKTNQTRGLCCTYVTRPPEVWNYEYYSYPVDLWAFGISIYRIISNTWPIVHASQDRQRAHANKGDIVFNSSFTQTAADFITRVIFPSVTSLVVVSVILCGIFLIISPG